MHVLRTSIALFLIGASSLDLQGSDCFSNRHFALTVRRQYCYCDQILQACAYSPDGTQIGILSAHLEDSPKKPLTKNTNTKWTATIVSVATSACCGVELEYHYSRLAFSNDGRRFVVWSPNCSVATVYSTIDCKPVFKLRFRGDDSLPVAIAFDENNRGVVVGNNDGTIELHSITHCSIDASSPYKSLAWPAPESAANEIHRMRSTDWFLAMTPTGAGVFRTFDDVGRPIPGVSGAMATSADVGTLASIRYSGPSELDVTDLAVWKLAPQVNSQLSPNFERMMVRCDAIRPGIRIGAHGLSCDGRLYCLLLRDGRFGLGRVEEQMDFEWYHFPRDSNAQNGLQHPLHLVFSPVTAEMLIVTSDGMLRRIGIKCRQ